MSYPIISKIRINKYYKITSWIIKIMILVNLILGAGYILYITEYVNPFPFYYDLIKPYLELLKPYIESVKNLWNELINIDVEESLINKTKESNNIKNQVKEGIKDGVKEALGEVLSELQEDLHQSQANSDLLRQFALVGSVLFFGYFLFILPGAAHQLVQKI